MQDIKDYTGSVYGGLANLLYLYCQHKNLPISQRLEDVQKLERLDFSVWRELLKDIHDLHPISALGLDIAQFVQPKHIGIMAYIALSCENLAEALCRYHDFYRLIYDGTPLSFDIQNDYLFIHWDEFSNVLTTQATDEIALAVMVQFLRYYLRLDEVQIHEVHFRYPAPKNVHIYEQFFGCKVKFSQPTVQIIVPIHFLSLPIKQADAALHKLLSKQAHTLLKRLPSTTQIDVRLQQSILKGLHQNTYQIEEVATHLNMSVRQLQRYLQQQKTTYQERLHQVRKGLALQYLQDPYLSLQEIALLLSYSEQSAFQRAFKQWMGITPQQWRLMHHNQ